MSAKQSNRHFSGVAVRAVRSEAAIAEVLEAVGNREPRLFTFCNAATINHASRSPEFREVLGKAVLFNDGIGLDMASALLYGSFFPQNLNGTDLVPRLLAAVDRPLKIYLLGSLPGVAEKAATTIGGYNPQITIVGTQDGYFPLTETDAVVAQIGAAAPDLVLVGMGQPRQEIWSDQVITRIGVPFLCVGAFLDFASGRIPRAPKYVRMMRMEWLYRLALEPRRLFGRYILGAGPYFTMIFSQRFGKSRGR